MINSLAAMPIDKLKRAVEIREQIEALIRELDELMGVSNFLGSKDNHRGVGAHNGSTQHNGWSMESRVTSGKPRLSADGRAKVSAAVKARWERYRAAKARTARAK